jgi:hypothetical protein
MKKKKEEEFKESTFVELWDSQRAYTSFRYRASVDRRRLLTTL